MSTYRKLDRRAPEEIRKQIALQIKVDNTHLAAIPIDGLYRLHEQLIVDDLTGVLVRRAGIAAVADEIENVRQTATPKLAVAFVDVDALKTINDNRGHAAGDLVLNAVADALKVHLRRRDVIFRYGGDEFVCAMPSMSLEAAAGRLIAAWRVLTTARCCSFSAGFADLRPDDDTSTLIARADECLYAGRRRSQRRDWRIAQ
jgi:diguanylate cyclase